MLKTKCFIVGGMILFSSLQAKAFIPTSNTAACAAVATTLAANAAANAAVLKANANKERERDKEKEPDAVTTAFLIIALVFSFALLFMCLSRLDGLSSGKDNDI